MLCTFCQSNRHSREACPILSNNYSINDQLYDLKHDLQMQLNVLKNLQEKLHNMQLNEQRAEVTTRTMESQTHITAIVQENGSQVRENNGSIDESTSASTST
jgi:hypothetical protein